MIRLIPFNHPTQLIYFFHSLPAIHKTKLIFGYLSLFFQSSFNHYFSQFYGMNHKLNPSIIWTNFYTSLFLQIENKLLLIHLSIIFFNVIISLKSLISHSMILYQRLLRTSIGMLSGTIAFFFFFKYPLIVVIVSTIFSKLKLCLIHL